MFEDLFERPHTIEKYRSAPLYEDRLRYLVHASEGGAAPWTLYKIAYCQLNLVRLLDLRDDEAVTLSRLTAAVEARFDREEPSGGQRAPSKHVKRVPRMRSSMVRFVTASRNQPNLATLARPSLTRSPSGCATSGGCRNRRSTAAARPRPISWPGWRCAMSPLATVAMVDVDEFSPRRWPADRASARRSTTMPAMFGPSLASRRPGLVPIRPGRRCHSFEGLQGRHDPPGTVAR